MRKEETHMISYEYYTVLLGEASSLPTAEQLIGDMGYPPDMPENGEDYVKMMNIIFAVANGTFKELFELSGMKLTEFTARFKLPYRSAQSWVYGERTAPSYINQLIGYAMIGDIYAA
jgi:hypothetical protein